MRVDFDLAREGARVRSRARREHTTRAPDASIRLHSAQVLRELLYPGVITGSILISIGQNTLLRCEY